MINSGVDCCCRHREDPTEDGILIPDALVNRIGEVAATVLRQAANLRQFMRIRDPQVAQHQDVYEAEDRGVGADRQRERQGGHRGEPRRPAHRPERVPDIPNQILDPVHTPHVPALLLNQRNVAKLPERGVASVGRRQSGSAVEFDLPFEVIAQLGVELLRDTMAAEQRPKAKADRPEQAHRLPWVTDKSIGKLVSVIKGNRLLTSSSSRT